MRTSQHQPGGALGKNDNVLATETSAGYHQAFKLKKVGCRSDRLGLLIVEGVIAGDLDTEGYAAIEASGESQADWVAHVTEVASGTLYYTARSWYVGANIPGKPQVFMIVPLPGKD